MKLIPKQKIKEAAKEFFKFEDPSKDFLRAFTYGAQFAQNEMPTLFCEFAEFYHTVADLEKTYYNRDCKQLFELWMEEREEK